MHTPLSGRLRPESLPTESSNAGLGADAQMVIGADYPFLDVVWTIFVFFGFVIWIWTLFMVFADLFSRHDISGWGKAGWTLLVIVLPLLGVLIYLIAEGKG